jgi:putative membrane protein
MVDDKPESRELKNVETPLGANELAAARTILAIERNFMALVRTSVSLIGFGFTIYKFLEALKANDEFKSSSHFARNLGLFLILLGMSLLILGYIQFNRLKALVRGDYEQRVHISTATVAGAGVLIAGMLALLNIFFGFGGS